MARTMGTLIRELTVVGTELAAIVRGLEELLSEALSLSASADEWTRHSMTSEARLSRTFGSHDPIEKALMDALTDIRDQEKKFEKDIELWIDTSFDEPTMKTVRGKIFPSWGFAIVGGGVASRVSSLVQDVKNLISETKDLERRLPYFKDSSGEARVVDEPQPSEKISAARDRVFVAYCHRNKRWLERLKTHLTPLVRKGILELWEDTQLKPGTAWRDEISKALAKASVAVLMISADFLASEFIATKELPDILNGEKERGLVVVPVFVAPCRIPEGLANFQGINDPKRTLEEITEADADRILVQLVDFVFERSPE